MFGTCRSFLVLLMLCGAVQAGGPATDGWDISDDNATTVLTRSYAGEVFTIHVSAWRAAGGEKVKTWLKAHKSQRSDGVPVVSTNHKVQSSRIEDVYYVLRQLRVYQGQRRLSLLMACEREDGAIRTIDAFGVEPFFNKTIPGALRDSVEIARYYCIGDGADASAHHFPATVPTDPISFAATPEGFQQMQGVLYYGIQAGGTFGVTSRVIALFDDGTYTQDIATAFDKGVEVSRRDNPRDWGEWRMPGEALTLKDQNDAEFEEPDGDWLAGPGAHDQRLSGCFGRLVSNDGMGVGTVMVGRASSWCFTPGGRFTHESTGFAIGTADVRGAVSSTPPGLRGRYRIDGYVLHLVYDDGSDLRAGFAFLNDEKTHIAINGRRFTGSDAAD